MVLLDVLIELKARSLDRPFLYAYDGDLTIEPGMRVYVPFNKQELVGYVLKVEQTHLSIEEVEKKRGFVVEKIISVLDEAPILSNELVQLSEIVSSYYYAPHISVLQAMLPVSLRPTRGALSGPKIAYDTYVSIAKDDDSDLTPALTETYLFVKSNGPTLRKHAGNYYRVSKLLESGHFKLEYKEKRRYELPKVNRKSKPKLTTDQNKVIEEFFVATQSVALLEGVTGSGKTEVYLAIAEAYVKKGEGVIMLVPEIALTPMMVKMFLSRYGEEVAVLHSELTNAQRYDEYRRIASGKAQIVVGVRSAIFAPVKNLGLIILDEEHVESYKQSTDPYYHAREVALFRAQLSGAKVLLGSATPSLETRTRALKGVYKHLRLPKRINEQALPTTHIIDMQNPTNFAPESVIFSRQLLGKLKEVVNKGEQAILLINRRGYATYVNCRSCNHVFKCPNDQATLTYHEFDKMLKCHHCDHVEFFPTTCPNCQNKTLWKTGFGTQRVEEEVNKLVPNAKTLRLDSDSAKVRSKIAKTLKQFADQEANILIGTQMIAKGHDFPNVTLVGVVLADLGLNFPSYRSSETTFQLITQAVGRSGRSDKIGSAYIQTNMPNHYVINLAAKQDYETFYNYEMRIRNMHNYPPYSYLMKVSISSKDKTLTAKTAAILTSDLQVKLKDDAEVLGPLLPYIDYLGGYYFQNIIIKYKNYFKIKPELFKAFKPLIENTRVTINIDVDTLDI